MNKGKTSVHTSVSRKHNILFFAFPGNLWYVSTAFFLSRNCLFVALLGGFMYHYSTRSLRICPSCSLNRESLPALPFSRSEVGFPYSTARVGESFFFVCGVLTVFYLLFLAVASSLW